ncbi:TetR/AcrR family transcriptional regulator [Billgrantia endophytica]|uniref:TetR/AcrR family transcriptional regulator n=1 Tax=Billgrantia endophytica TaxID=2033802 RepID=UPI0013FD871E|nr:TetR/AcrR family transcriptional regulator [Halomonas endophytica]
MQKEIADAAHALFVERGYEETKIDDIAAAVGMSQRSVFRYFETKEELVIGKFDFAAAAMLAIVRDRPMEEAVWVSLRRVFDEMVAPCDDPGQRPAAVSILSVVFGTPALFAAYLQKMHQLQEAIVEALLERANAAGRPYAGDDPAPRALTAAAFGCLVAAQHSWLAGGTTKTFAQALDQAMAAVRSPQVPPRTG